MIILFGSYARGDYKEQADLKPDRKSGHASDYDILAVTREKTTATNIGLWESVTKECDNAGLSTHARIIAHDIQELNIKLAEDQYFYTDVKKEGCLLYDSKNFKLARKRKLKPEEKKRIAQDYFDSWYKSAQQACNSYHDAFKRGDNNWAAFSLHQTTEACYKGILLVFTNYNPNEHMLVLLGNMVSRHDSALSDIFPKETDQQLERFMLLDYAYIGARYDPDYRITRDDLEYLSKRVKLLLDLTEKICEAKIESLA